MWLPFLFGGVLCGSALHGQTSGVAPLMSGDCAVSNAGVTTCTKTNGTVFAASATSDTTNAGNIGSGTLSNARTAALTGDVGKAAGTGTTTVSSYNGGTVFGTGAAQAACASITGIRYGAGGCSADGVASSAQIAAALNSGPSTQLSSSLINWSAPGAIGAVAPGSGAFTTLAVGGTIAMLHTGFSSYGDVIQIADTTNHTYTFQGAGSTLYNGATAGMTGWYLGIGVLSSQAAGAGAIPIFGINTGNQGSGVYGVGKNMFNVQINKAVTTYNNTLDDGAGGSVFVQVSATRSVGAGFHETLFTPASSTAACAAGDFADDANFHYVCTAANTWKRAALSAF